MPKRTKHRSRKRDITPRKRTPKKPKKPKTQRKPKPVKKKARGLPDLPAELIKNEIAPKLDSDELANLSLVGKQANSDTRAIKKARAGYRYLQRIGSWETGGSYTLEDDIPNKDAFHTHLLDYNRVFPLEEFSCEAPGYYFWEQGFPECLGELHHLQKLRLIDLEGGDLSSKSLKTLATCLETLPKLETLSLMGIGVTETHLGGIANMPKLQNLELSMNPVTKIDFLEGIRGLVTCNISNTQITDIRPLKDQTRLTSLVMSGCSLTQGKPLTHLKRLTKLDSLDVMGAVKTLEGCEKLTALTTLYCGDNQLTSLEPLKHLRKLDTISAEDNHIEDVSALANVESLRTLYLNSNKIKDVSPLRDLKHLDILDLSENKVTQDSLETAVEGMSSLNVLRISENRQCTSLAFALNISSLKELSAEGIRIQDQSTIQKLRSKLKSQLRIGGYESESSDDLELDDEDDE